MWPNNSARVTEQLAKLRAQLAAWFGAAVRAPELKPKLAVQELDPAGICGPDFGAYLQRQYAEYGRVILPFTVLRRLDCVLAPTKAKAIAEHETRDAQGLNPEPFLLRVTGIPATEAQALCSRGDQYREYQRTTSAFVPWFPKGAA